MELYIIRHAQSTNNALADQRDRVCDPRLTELGRRQAHILAQHLANGANREPNQPGPNPANHNVHNGRGYGITRLYCSPMWRALQTARPVGQALGLTPEVWTDIHECGGVYLDHGEAGGLMGHSGITRSELLAAFPDYIVPPAITDEGWWHDGHEESAEWEARATHVAKILNNLVTSEERIAIITHGGFANALLKSLLGWSSAQRIFYHHDNASISLVEFRDDGRLTVRYLNRTDHLPLEMLS